MRTYVIEHGDVWLVDGPDRGPGSPSSAGRSHVCRASERLGFAHDGDVVYKRGSAEGVRAWAGRNAHACLDDMVVVDFPVTEETVALLNDLAAGRCDWPSALRILEALQAPTGPR